MNLKSYLAEGVNSFPVLDKDIYVRIHRPEETKRENKLHVEGELVLRLKISRSKLPFHFGVDPRNGESNASQHVVRRNPVHMVLIHLGSYDDPFVIVIVASSSLRCSSLLDYFRVSAGILVGVGFVHNRVRLVGACRSAGEAHRCSSDSSCR